MTKKIIAILCVALVLVCSLPFTAFATETEHTHEYDPVPITDEACHWYVCMCGATTTREAHYGGTATTTEYAVCVACGVSYGDLATDTDTDTDSGGSSSSGTTHTHVYEYSPIIDGIHQYSCSCGEVVSQALCTIVGGICSVCKGYPRSSTLTTISLYDASGNYLGTLWTTSTTPRFFFNLNASGSMSFALNDGATLVDDGVGYISGSANTILIGKGSDNVAGLSVATDNNITSSGDIQTATQKYFYLTVGTAYKYYVYTDEDIVTHTHEYDPVPIFDEACHWYVCTCGATTTREAHYGGTATTTEYAVCVACGVSYGDLATAPEETDHVHEYDPVHKTDGEYHWKECVHCGDVIDVEDHTDLDGDGYCDTCAYGLRVHSGDTYAYNEDGHWKVCTVCGVNFEVGQHSGGEATCVQKAVCEACGVAYGEFGAHIDFDNDKTCDDCGYVSDDVDVGEYDIKDLISGIARAPSQFIDGMLSFEVFGVNVAQFVKMLFTFLLVAFVVVFLVRFLI